MIIFLLLFSLILLLTALSAQRFVGDWVGNVLIIIISVGFFLKPIVVLLLDLSGLESYLPQLIGRTIALNFRIEAFWESFAVSLVIFATWIFGFCCGCVLYLKRNKSARAITHVFQGLRSKSAIWNIALVFFAIVVLRFGYNYTNLIWLNSVSNLLCFTLLTTLVCYGAAVSTFSNGNLKYALLWLTIGFVFSIVFGPKSFFIFAVIGVSVGYLNGTKKIGSFSLLFFISLFLFLYMVHFEIEYFVRRGVAFHEIEGANFNFLESSFTTFLNIIRRLTGFEMLLIDGIFELDSDFAGFAKEEIMGPNSKTGIALGLLNTIFLNFGPYAIFLAGLISALVNKLIYSTIIGLSFRWKGFGAFSFLFFNIQHFKLYLGGDFDPILMFSTPIWVGCFLFFWLRLSIVRNQKSV